MINTDIIRTIPEKVLAGMTAAVPLRRVGEPEEVSALVAYLASDEGSYISGQCINITGGWW
jgi:NAD(P)-dependent dehydrogenase (short-subunit alcohol dehydrogenase family)